MFVVKNSPDRNAFDVIAGEMLNREQSVDHFVDGVARTEMPASYVGYPAHVTPTRRYVLKAVKGFIYIPTSLSQKRFVESIEEILAGKPLVRLDCRELSMKTSHRSGNNYATVRIANTDIARRYLFADGTVVGPSKGTAKFTWAIVNAGDINTTVNVNDPSDTISRLAGIFWDADDITVHPHGTTTFQFSEDSLKATQRLCGEKLSLLPGKCLLAFELSAFWRDDIPGTEASTFMRDVNRRKLVSADFAGIEVKPVRIDDNSPATSTDICFRCKELLYGDVYCLAGCLTKQDEEMVRGGKIVAIPICALCMHTIPEDAPIENKYVRVLRVKWPRESTSAVQCGGFSEQKTDILNEVSKSFTPYETEVRSGIRGTRPVKFYLLGDKYAGFANLDDYKLTRLVNAPILAGRTVCKVVVVE